MLNDPVPPNVDEPWTHAHAEVIERLHALEAEEEAAASPTGLD